MEKKMTRYEAAEKLWKREGGHCVSVLVSNLAGADMERVGASPHTGRGSDLLDLISEAQELCYPLQDYESAAMDAGWTQCPAPDGRWWRIPRDESELEDGEMFLGSGPFTFVDDAEGACRLDDLEPHEREIFEHWIVSPWLAGKLAAKGERTGELAGLHVWGRTCTGQGIACDGVMKEIAAECFGADRVEG